MSRVLKNTEIKGKLYFTKDLATVVQTLVSNQNQFLWSQDDADVGTAYAAAIKIFRADTTVYGLATRVITAESLDGVLSLYQTYWCDGYQTPWTSTGAYPDRYICDGQIYNFSGIEYYRWIKHEWIRESRYQPYYLTTKENISFYTPVSLNIIGYVKDNVPVQVESAVCNNLGENLIGTYYQLPWSTTITGQKLMYTQVGTTTSWSQISGTPKVYRWEYTFVAPATGSYSGWTATFSFISPTTLFTGLTSIAKNIDLSVPIHVTIKTSGGATIYSDNLNTLAAKRTQSGSPPAITFYITLTSRTVLECNNNISLANFRMKMGSEVKYEV